MTILNQFLRHWAAMYALITKQFMTFLFQEELRRAAIGVNHASKEKMLVETIGQAFSPAMIMSKYTDLMLKNVFPDDEQPLVDEASDAVLDEIIGFATLGHGSFSRLNSL